MLRPRELEDDSDRAQKKRKPGLCRIPLDRIGYWPNNRGGLGVSNYHVHEVAHDCLANKTKLQRYSHVDLIEIPAELLQHVREVNRVGAANDALAAAFSPTMEYVCASKTHFVHAQKLASCGTRSLFNKGETAIRWQPTDGEGAEILKHGPLCAIYDSSVYADVDAVLALSSDDNLNAHVQMAEDEMQAFGRRSSFFKGPVDIGHHPCSIAEYRLGRFFC
jgi:hypothetical protein